MTDRNVNPSPGPEPDPSDQRQRIQWIVDFWTLLYIGEDSGETTWQELDALQVQVTDALAATPPNITRAETLTAYAAALVSGLLDF
jgi:hypothetical protein